MKVKDLIKILNDMDPEAILYKAGESDDILNRRYYEEVQDITKTQAAYYLARNGEKVYCSMWSSLPVDGTETIFEIE